MKQLRGADIPFEPADSRNFVGSARVKRLPLVEGGEAPVMGYLVEFQAAARTNWHTHSGPQLLLIHEGQGLVQKWGEPVREMKLGDAITIEPNEKHWHGAAPRQQNDALRHQSELHDGMARARIGRPISCILS